MHKTIFLLGTFPCKPELPALRNRQVTALGLQLVLGSELGITRTWNPRALWFCFRLSASLFSPRRLSSSRAGAHFPFLLGPGILLTRRSVKTFVRLFQEGLHASFGSLCKMELLLCGCLHAFLSGSLCIWFRRMDLQWDSKVLCFTSQARVSVLYFTLTCLHTSPIGAHLRTAGWWKYRHIFAITSPPGTLWGPSGCPEVIIWLNQLTVKSRKNLDDWALPGHENVMLSHGKKKGMS